MKKMRRGVFAGSAVAVLMLTAACGSGDNSAGKGDSVQPVGDSKQAGSGYDGYGGGSGAVPAADAVKNGPAGELKVKATTELGPTVTDSAGFTLYRFDKDTPKPPKSNCEGDCATAWPAVSADDASAGEGIDKSLLGSVERADGTKQLTLAGWPVYRYAKDTKAGDTLGEGVGGTWHVLAPDGKPAKAGGGAGSGSGADPSAGGGAGEEAGAGEAGGGQEKAQADPVGVNRNTKLGAILTDAEGRTLYRFDKDSAWPMKTNCLGACLNTWKPAKAVDKELVKGIPAELVGTFKRPDGTEQLTIDCWPMYTFAGDKEAGDINGQGKQGTWFAVSDKGKKVTATG